MHSAQPWLYAQPLEPGMSCTEWIYDIKDTGFEPIDSFKMRYEYVVDSTCVSPSVDPAAAGGVYTTPHVTHSSEIPLETPTQYATASSLPPKGKEKEEELERGQTHIHIPNKDQVEIDRKRKKNTMAARKSRMKKLEHKVALEKAVERLTTEKEIWKTRALTLRSLLNNNGIPCPDFNDWLQYPIRCVPNIPFHLPLSNAILAPVGSIHARMFLSRANLVC